MFRNIVVAVDGSPRTERALAVAIALAKGEGAMVCVCSIVDLLPIGGGDPATTSTIDLQVDAERRAERTLKDAIAQATAAGVRADGCVIVGEPAGDIIDYTREQSGDAIVIGTEGPLESQRSGHAALEAATVPVISVTSPANGA
jgi:nucleotide-binding universal stress UspA family protein